MIEDLDKLIELQNTDTNIRRLRKLLDTAGERRAAIENEFNEQASAVRAIQDRRQGLTSKRSELEKQIADNKVYLERAERNLKHAQNSKEYETAMREIDALQKGISTLENQTVEMLDELETVDKELTERADEIAGHDSKLADALAVHDDEAAKAEAELKSETAKRAASFATLSPQLASVYDRLATRSRDGIAVAEVQSGSCSACYMSLRPQMLLEVKRGTEIITCENCARILYVVKAPAGEATVA
ncbi:MAG: hypothetical protein HS105_12450 [Chloracidobacterium sp.]|nr:hypothetical protein [Chloracidobacterium sp.]MCC6825721.1 hypothetical protein [Acidobacteriota bacterium]MCO5332873.1 C4-type zinc ribbon domain-containing protein [Pyrinomonadaceae bacterium]